MPRLSIKHVWAMLAPALVFIATGMDRQYLTDFWHHLARGQQIVQTGAMLDTDVFTFTVAGHRIVDVNWLTQVIYHGLYSAGGIDLVQLVNSLVLALMAGGLVWLCWRACGNVRVAALVSIAALAAMWPLFTVRPQTFSMLLFVGMAVILDLSRTRRWLIWLAPALMILWVNMHGAFAAGLMLLGCHVVADAWERRSHRSAAGLVMIAAIAATLVNPYGIRAWQYMWQTASVANGRGIEEWLAPALNSALGWSFWISVVVVGLSLALRRRRPAAREVLLIILFLPLAIRSVRMQAWWVLAMAPVVASGIATLLPRRLEPGEENRGGRIAALAAMLLLLVGVALSVPVLERLNPLMGTLRPAGRLEGDLEQISTWLRDHPGNGRVFTRLEWGEYFTWSAWPACRVFMDGRIEIYPDDLWQDYQTISTGEARWERILANYDVQHLVLDRTYHQKLMELVEQSPHWKQMTSAGPAVLFTRL